MNVSRTLFFLRIRKNGPFSLQLQYSFRAKSRDHHPDAKAEASSTRLAQSHHGISPPKYNPVTKGNGKIIRPLFVSHRNIQGHWIPNTEQVYVLPPTLCASRVSITLLVLNPTLSSSPAPFLAALLPPSLLTFSFLFSSHTNTQSQSFPI